MNPDPFFAYARERHSITLRRAAGRPRETWTSDPVLSQYRFCSVFRELDMTTQWFRTHVRDPLRDTPEVLLATVIFRWFNRIVSGEAIFQQCRANFAEGSVPGETGWDELLRSGSTDGIRDSLVCWCGGGPYVTGSYIIKTPDGMSKLDGVLWCIRQFMERGFRMPGVSGELDWRKAASLEVDACVSLEMMWAWLRQFPYMGDFMAYEVVTDLRHTALLDRAPDIMTWANPGPGARRGLNRLHGRPLHLATPRSQLIQEMRDLLEMSLDPLHWPKTVGQAVIHADDFLPVTHQGRSDWPAWEMRDVEHTLCEFDKYERARLGEGRPRQVFRG